MKNVIKSTTLAVALILLTTAAWAGPGEIGSANESQGKILCSEKLPDFANVRSLEVEKGIDTMTRTILTEAYRLANVKLNSITFVKSQGTQNFYHVDAGKDSINAVAIYKLPAQGTFELLSSERYTQFDSLGRPTSQGIRCLASDRMGINGYSVEVYNSDTNRFIDRDARILNSAGVEILLPDNK